MTRPKWLTVVAVLAVLWNLLGVVAFALGLVMSTEDVARLSEAERTIHQTRPGWSVAGTGLAVTAGVLGSIGLWLGRRWAVPALGLSLLGVLLQDVGFAMVGINPGAAVLGLQGFVLLVAALLFWLAMRASARGWLR